MTDTDRLIARRDALRAELEAVQAKLDDLDECPGEGKCHGCLAWCDRCGDVKTVCDCEGCAKHRCQECDQIKPPEHGDFWSYVCDDCDAAEASVVA